MLSHGRILTIALAIPFLSGCSGCASNSDPNLTANLGGDVTLQLVLIKPGRFQMGSSLSEQEQIRTALKPKDNWQAQEQQHEVELTKPFYMGIYEVTQAQYVKLMRHNPSYFCATGQGRDSVQGRDTAWLPVDSVSWEDAIEFCKRLSEKDGRQFDLPTEAEWEFACRAGATGPFSFGSKLSPRDANYDGSSVEKSTMVVGSHEANEFGLYDMHGNVAEWCKDWYDRDYYRNGPRNDPLGPTTGTQRVLRGGSWFHEAALCRSAARGSEAPHKRENSFGFRVVMRP